MYLPVLASLITYHIDLSVLYNLMPRRIYGIRYLAQQSDLSDLCQWSVHTRLEMFRELLGSIESREAAVVAEPLVVAEQTIGKGCVSLHLRRPPYFYSKHILYCRDG